jgi:hypothetical protein
MLNSLPDIQGFGEGMFQFDVKIPTKLWKAILRRRKLVADGNSNYVTNLTLGQARNARIENDMGPWTYEDASVLDILDTSSPLRHVMPGSVYISPLDTELFDRFDINVLRGVVLFRNPSIINFNIVLHGIGGSTVEAIFDVSRFPDFLSDRPSGALVSCTINV